MKLHLKTWCSFALCLQGSWWGWKRTTTRTLVTAGPCRWSLALRPTRSVSVIARLGRVFASAMPGPCCDRVILILSWLVALAMSPTKGEREGGLAHVPREGTLQPDALSPPHNSSTPRHPRSAQRRDGQAHREHQRDHQARHHADAPPQRPRERRGAAGRRSCSGQGHCIPRVAPRRIRPQLGGERSGRPAADLKHTCARHVSRTLVKCLVAHTACMAVAHTTCMAMAPDTARWLGVVPLPQ